MMGDTCLPELVAGWLVGNYSSLRSPVCGPGRCRGKFQQYGETPGVVMFGGWVFL